MNRPRQSLTLFDSTSLIVGIIIGAGIYQMAPAIAQGVGSGWGVIGLWVAGGLLSLCGALCYAELATTYPQEGGDYVYLSKAYGPWAGFMFGWAQLAIVRPGDIAVMAFAFATYARTLWDPLAGTAYPYAQQCYAVGAVVVLTAINVIGVREGKWTQNLLTTVKALGLLMIVGVAVFTEPGAPAETEDVLPLSLALIFVLFTYGGWNEMAYVAAEVKNPRKNIVRALVLGTVAVMVLYILANGAFLHVLGFEGLKASEAVATDVVDRVLPSGGGGLISALICISALGAVNGLVFTGARISYAIGADHRMFKPLGHWNERRGTPANALLIQGVIAVTLIIVLGSFIDAILYTAAVVYSFYLASTAGIIVLRWRDTSPERPFRTPGYPMTPLLFGGVCVFLIYSAVTYKPLVAGVACVLLLLGLPLYWLSSRKPARGSQ